MNTNISELNPEQKEAVSHNTGPCIIIAGAGTGKTKVLTSRICYLIENKLAKPEEILALTFTEKATQEMEERIDVMMPLSYGEIWIKTFHSFCDTILRERGIEIGLDPGYKILTEPDLLVFLKQNLFQFSLDYFRPLGNPSKFLLTLLSFFSKLKDEHIFPNDYKNWVETQSDQLLKTSGNLTQEEKEIIELEMQKQDELARVYHEFQEKLIEKNFLDYGDLIYYTNLLLQKRPNVLHHYQHAFKYILVDEYQDTNLAQNAILKALSKHHQNIMVVGDDDQAIYRFRGASVSNILQFKDSYPEAKQIVLTKNYRSKQAILDFSYLSIQNNNPERLESLYNIEKKLHANTKEENTNTPSITEAHAEILNDEIHFVIEKIKSLQNQYALGDIAILGRARAHLMPFHEALVKQGISVKKTIEENYKTKAVIKDILSIMRVLAYPHNDVHFFRVLKMKEWNIPMETILNLVKKAKSSYKNLWEALKEDQTFSSSPYNIKEFIPSAIEFSREHNVTEVLFHKILQKLEFFQRYEKEANDESIANIQAISKLLYDTQHFVEHHDDTSIKAYIDYLDLTEESSAGSSKALNEETDLNSVTLSTVHGSKGLEYKVVFIVNTVNDRFPARRKSESITIPESLRNDKSTIDEKEYHIMEERRLFYVACTRAKEQLFLTWSDYQSSEAKRKSKKSRFLTEIEDKTSNLHRYDIPKQDTIQSMQEKPQKEHIETQAIEKPLTPYSYSHLSVYEICPKKYQYQYVYKIPTPPSAALSFGSTLHNTLSEFYKIIQCKQTSMFQEEEKSISLEILLSIYEKHWIPHGYKSKGHMEARKKRGKEILTAYYKKFEGYFGNPLYLEKAFTLRIGDIVIKGRFDRVDSISDDNKIVEIFDYKTGKTKSQKDTDNDLQLSIYALAAKESLGKEVDSLSLYFLDENIKIETKRDEKSLDKAKEKIEKLVDGIRKKDFHAKPNKIMCSYCDFRNICEKAVL